MHNKPLRDVLVKHAFLRLLVDGDEQLLEMTGGTVGGGIRCDNSLIISIRYNLPDR